MDHLRKVVYVQKRLDARLQKFKDQFATLHLGSVFQLDRVKYKVCGEKRNYIVMLYVPNYVQTNETRTVTDRRFAKYRCERAWCIAILKKCNIFVPKINHRAYIIRSFHYITYRAGCMMYPDGFTCDLEKVCGQGLHYYNSLLPCCIYPISFTSEGAIESHVYDTNLECLIQLENYLQIKTVFFVSGQKDVEYTVDFK